MTDEASEYVGHTRAIDANIAYAELAAKYGGGADPDVATEAPPAPTATAAPPEGAGKMQMVPALGGGAAAVVKGATESPRALVTGAIAAVQNTAQLALDVHNLTMPGLKLPTKVPTIPTPDDPESGIGQMLKGVTQFTGGFAGAGKALAAWSSQAIGKQLAKGAVADMTVFDPHMDNLANLAQKFPALQGPLADALAASPDDTEWEGRAKNALQGLGLGAATVPFVAALKVLKSAPAAQAAIDKVRPSLPEGAIESVLGDPAEPLARMSVKGFAAKAAREMGGIKPIKGGDAAAMARGADELKGAVPEPETFINFSRIDTPDDVKNVMQRMADTYKKSIDTARRGTQTFEEIKLNAEQKNAWNVLQERRAGQPLNAEESVAARNLWAASGMKLSEVAQVTADAPTPANLFAFQKMLVTHRLIQQEVIAARTETARALASWRIPATGGGARRLAEIENMLAAAGGKQNVEMLAEKIASLARAGMTGEMDSVVERSTIPERIAEAWINGLLSGPKTHFVNAVSNTSVIFQSLYERAFAARIDQALGRQGGVELGEAMAQWHGMVSSIPDALRYMAKTWRTGESGFGVGKVESARPRSISAEAFGIRETGWYGTFVNVAGNAANIPVRALGAVDEFFKTVGYRGEVQALALRQATQEMRAAGNSSPEALKTRVAELAANPPDSIYLNAVDAAQYRTFTNAPGKLATLIGQGRDLIPGAKYVLPFVRTPANIMNYTFERTPLAPLMRHVRADLAAGGSRRSTAQARIAGGTAIMLWASDMAQRGLITGKGPVDAERAPLLRENWQPYSWKVGDRYYAFNRFDPLGSLLGMSADVTDIIANDAYGEEKAVDIDVALVAMAMSAGNNVLNKTYLKGPADAMEALTQGGSVAYAYFAGLGGTVVPTLAADVARAMDPYAHEADTIIERMRARTPGLSEGVPYRRDLWGRKMSYKSGLGDIYDLASPIYSRRENPEPIDKEIRRLEASFADASKSTSFGGITINLEKYPKAYERYVELAGNEAKDPAFHLGAKDFLNAVVTGKSPMWNVYRIGDDGPDGGKANFIQTTINQYRARAREQLLHEFKDIATEVEQKQKLKQARAVEAINNPSTLQ